ncbi:UPF0545 protein C22orf39 homolog isoform X2 [Alligator sinensis]|uniref:Synaptic plasticity regulator PANTS n=1 Tax=Alligator sinensis TaxID=38654 RepID=A0A3Q0GD07_ALLSI|nr:UPF0545 protein C22orf39 homolog isoform X2 [Alligator sinensis]
MADRDAWRPPRTCDDYWSEWKHCKGIQNLFHHYYTFGEAPSCAQWKTDYKDCREWEKNKSAHAKEKLKLFFLQTDTIVSTILPHIMIISQELWLEQRTATKEQIKEKDSINMF